MPSCTKVWVWSMSRAAPYPSPVSGLPVAPLHSSPRHTAFEPQVGMVKSAQLDVPTRWLTTMSAIGFTPLAFSMERALTRSVLVPYRLSSSSSRRGKYPSLEAASLGGGSHTRVNPPDLMLAALFRMTPHHGYVWCEFQWKPCNRTSPLLQSSAPAWARGASRTSASALARVTRLLRDCFSMMPPGGGTSPLGPSYRARIRRAPGRCLSGDALRSRPGAARWVPSSGIRSRGTAPAA